MTDSLYKDLVNLLAAGTWTATPIIKQVTQTVENLLEYAKNLADADGVVLVMPPRVENEFEDGWQIRRYIFQVYVYRFSFAGPDSGMDEFETLWEDIDSILQAAIISGMNDNSLDGWANLTDRHKTHNWGIGTITVEAWTV